MESSVNQQNDKSVYVVVSFNCGSCHGALYKVKLEHGEFSDANSGGAAVQSPPQVLVPIIKFFDKPLNLPKNCLFEGVRFGSCSKLYIMANGDGASCKPVTTTNSFVFDTDTDTTSVSGLQHFSPPQAAKLDGAVISAYGMLYYFAHPSCAPCIPDPSFERYNSATNLWESLPPCPYESLPKPSMVVAGYAVCFGYILISMHNSRDCAVIAFHIGSQTWHAVNITKSIYYPFVGRAVVVDGTIYSLTFSPNQVLAISFWRDSDDACYLGAPLPLQVRKTAKSPAPMLDLITQNLVHLGGLDFCLIETARNEYSIEHKYLRVTTFCIVGEGGKRVIRTLRSSIFQVDLIGSACGFLEVNFSFTPDCEDVEPEEDRCPTAPITSKSDSTGMTSEDSDKKADRRLYAATGRQQDFFSIPINQSGNSWLDLRGLYISNESDLIEWI